MNRVLKDGAKVPSSSVKHSFDRCETLSGNSTTSALCEHVDNAIEAGADEIRIFFRQSGKPGEYQIDSCVYDDVARYVSDGAEGRDGVRRLDALWQP